MGKLLFHNRLLYAVILGSSITLMVIALGPGLFGSGEIFNAWQYQVFDRICHQDPARSFQLAGVQMAVCSRCLGIYGLFMIGWILLPLFKIVQDINSQQEKKWLIAAIILNLVDVTGNYLGFWTNTLSSRLILGGILGITVAFLLTDEFFTIKKSV
ncbi:DUF2085 domain-containing protein [Gracilimonas tropica]|uniref:DUF2085 domain-containing protein n=1 Tax=Gracilimonas tropica TaxID=454600 RepID=UPI000380889D|nr:DUF2085 domain-containing protein [Gracilimonas tropica]